MNRFNSIYRHKRYRELLSRLQKLESDRKFCRHHLQHFLDVARIMYIIDLEENLNISKDIIYSAALLHDIGRVSQYVDGIPHNEAGAAIADEILKDCGFDETERNRICSAILCHRHDSAVQNDGLSRLLSRADKLSRNCFDCPASDECYWSSDIKNPEIQF